MALLFWPVVLLTLLVLFCALFGKPSKLLLLSSAAGTLLFASGAAYLWIQIARMPGLAAPRYYSLELEPPGTHVVRIASLPEIPGLHVRPILKAVRRGTVSSPEERLPISDVQIWSCGWKLRSPAISLHLHDDRCSCTMNGLLDTGFDERFRDGTFSAIELEYVVDDRTKPILAAIDLQVSYPFTYGNDLAMGEGIGNLIAWAFAGCAAIGVLGVIAQVIRRRNGGKGDDRGTLHSPLPR
ncbi:MAG TPA: hypothetical protein VNM14_25560 [Planctomycetota bacterium]|nr:hypothetical protein [Planctomycetota bacterium]